MSRRRIAAALLCSLLFANITASAQQPTASAQAPPTQAGAQGQPTPDPNDPVQRIKDEGMNRSQLMKTLSYLTNVIGPRLTGSPGMRRANEWTRDRLAEWGLQNAHLEAWGPFGRGWILKRFSAEVVEPQAFPLFAYPKAWSPPTPGPLAAEVVYVNATNEQELEKYKGTLRGKIVLNSPVRDLKAHFDPEASGRTERNRPTPPNSQNPGTPRPPHPRKAPPAFRAPAAYT